LKKKKRLGEMLTEAGLITDEQLQQALANHRKMGLKLGQYLTREGTVSEGQIVDVIARQLKIKKYNPEEFPIDMHLAQVISSETSQKYQVAPLEKKDFLLTIAMPDPMDIGALDAIEVMTNTEVEPVICTEQELNQLINSIYGTYSGLDNMMETMEENHPGPADPDENQAIIEDVEVTSLLNMAEEAPVVRLVNSILSQAVRQGASDIHISPEKDYVQVRFRVDGKLQEVPAPPKNMILPIISRFKILANLDISVSRLPQDGRFTARIGNREINIRVSTMPTIYGENVVLRLLDMSSGIHSLEALGMTREDREKVEAMSMKPYGMILSTGPTGSGKSTTLYSILKKINQPDINILTIEDPVEFRMPKIRQIQLNRRAGMTFASGLRSILRQDPDVIMVGEIRDTETAVISVQAALTGHRLMSTVHTNDAAGAITRFIEMGIEPYLISSVMLVSIAQRLIRRVCDYCKEPYQPPEAALRQWGMEADAATATFMKGRGCFNCMNTGYKGRVGVFEVLCIDETVQDMILAGRSAKEITRDMTAAGKLRTLKTDAAEKVRQGLTTLEEASAGIMS